MTIVTTWAGVNPSTLSTAISLGLRNRAQAVVLAYESGLVQAGSDPGATA